MKHFVKQKFYGKLLSFLKFKRHKKVRSFISFSKKKLDFNTRINYNSQKRVFFLKKLDPLYNTLPVDINLKIKDQKINKPNIKSNFLLKLKHQNLNIKKITSLNNKNIQQDNLKTLMNTNENTQQLLKKKYKLNSFLFNMLCHYSRGRLKIVNGKEFFTWYYTVPYRLSLSRFIGNKVLRSFYQNLNKKTLLNLRKKITIKAKRANLSSVIKNKKFNKKEMIKNLIYSLEKRLDSSLLRLFQFKSLYTKKYTLPIDYNKNDLNKKNLPIKNIFLKRPRFRSNIHSWKIRSPWKNYSSLQIKQKINHGHFYINGKKVKSPNIQINLIDKISIKGLIHNPLWNLSNNKNIETVKTGFNQNKLNINTKYLNNTFFFRNTENFLSDLMLLSNDDNLKQDISKWKEENNFNFNKIFLISNNTNENNKNLNLLCFYIKNSQIKHFSEMFYLTYKNFFLFSNSSIFSKESFSSSERLHNINFFFQNLGFNQSIYLLWPLISLLSVQSWNTEIKNNIIRSSRFSTKIKPKNINALSKARLLNTQNISTRNLKNLINLKNYQNKLFELESKKKILPSSPNILNDIYLYKGNYPSWVFNKSLNFYASFIYGTRKCKWIQLQQQKKGYFYNKVYNKIQFYELELDFFQLAYSHYNK